MTAPGARWRIAALLFVSLPLLGRSAVAASDAPVHIRTEASAPRIERPYKAYYLGAGELDALVAQFCSEEGGYQTCEGRFYEGYVRLSATEDVHSRFAAWLKVHDVPPPTQVFHVHLFTADNGSAPAEPIPAALAPVLKDLAGFLPFRSFHLISTGLVRTSRDGRIDLGSEPHFVVDLRFAGDPAGGKPLQIEQFELSRRQMVQGEGGAMQVANFDVLRTSFSMNVGETVVVGTSKLDGGDKALVVLLTAAK